MEQAAPQRLYIIPIAFPNNSPAKTIRMILQSSAHLNPNRYKTIKTNRLASPNLIPGTPKTTGI